MADNTTQAGNDTIATEEATTINGVASTGVKVPRSLAGFSDDAGGYRDASPQFPLPVMSSSDVATLTSVAAAITSTTVIAANGNRRGLTLHATTGSASVYIRVGGGTASSALGGHTFDLQAGGYWEAPFGFTGAVTAVWASAAGGLNVTEFS